MKDQILWKYFWLSLPACICGNRTNNSPTTEGLKLNGISVTAEGDIDKDFLLGKTTEGPAPVLPKIRSYVDIDADMTTEEKTKFLKRD